MKIRNAQEKDANKIREISLSLTIPRKTTGQLSGLLEYKTPTGKEIINRIKNNKFFYVAEISKKIIGFSSAYTDDNLRKLDFSEDEIVKHILKKQSSFIFWDILAIIEDFQNKGFGRKLAEKFMEDAVNSKYKILYGVISHKPHKNKISIDILKKLDWELIEEIEVYNGLIFGIYKKIL